jgi:hypothetical protein
MIKFVRLAALAAVATVVATPAAAQVAASPKATARVNVVKPLTLTREENLDFGTVVVTGDSTVSISHLGVGTCGVAADVTCDFTAAQAARYRVTGSNNQQVTVTATGSNLNRAGGGTIAFTPVLKNGTQSDTETLPNSGSTGTTFNVGGSIALLASLPGGVYTGDIEVTVQY